MKKVSNQNTVLFVDDEAGILSAIRRAVEDEAFTSFFANSGPEALRIMENNNIHVLITDMRMPDMNGLSLLKIVCEKYPHTVRIVLSGYTQISQVLATINQGEIFQFIPKPWKMEEELLLCIKRAIERYNLEYEKEQLQLSLEKENAAYQSILKEMELKIDTEKKVLTNLKRVQRWIFTFWKKYYGETDTATNSSKSNVYINLIEEIQLTYIDTLPIALEVKNQDEIIAQITASCSSRLNILSVDENAYNFSGYIRFLSMVCKVLVHLLSPAKTSVVDCLLSVITSENGTKSLQFYLTQKQEQLQPLAKTSLTIGCSLLSEIGRIYGTGVIDKSDDGPVSSAIINWIPSKIE